LSNLGLGHRGSVLSLYLLGAFSGATALVVSYLPSLGAAIVGVITLALIFAGVAYLERAPYERQDIAETPAEKSTLNQFAD
jgi:hypothetical protein